MALSNYPPGVTGNEPQIVGYTDENLFLVCQDCGESFDEMDTAANHSCEENEEMAPTYMIVLESEAL